MWGYNRSMALRYTVILETDPSGLIVAHVPALGGCVSQGKTKREALKNVREAIGVYIEALIDHGQPVPTESGREIVELSVT